MRQVVVYPGEDNDWVVECLSLPGCISQGKNRKEALKNIKDAIKSYIAALEEDVRDSGRSFRCHARSLVSKLPRILRRASGTERYFEMMSALITEEQLRARAQAGSESDFYNVLSKVPAAELNKYWKKYQKRNWDKEQWDGLTRVFRTKT